jgi:hypothetical protein
MTAIAGLLVAYLSALAQSPSGAITGTITDGQGARAPGVQVTALHIDTNIPFKITSSADETYVIPNLPLGTYEVSAAAAGFKIFRRGGLTLEVAQRLRLDIALDLDRCTARSSCSMARPTQSLATAKSPSFLWWTRSRSSVSIPTA